MAIKHDQQRTADAERKRASRKEQRLVVIPACEDRQRRERLEADDQAWLMYYFGEGSEVEDPFWYQFTDQQQEMIAAIRAAIVHGGDQAIAASRGEGKTTVMERLLLKYTLQGILSYSVLFASTGTLAENSLDTIKSAIEDNPLLLADYPEVCVPVAALENTPNRAHYQIVAGQRHDTGEAFSGESSKFSWCGQEVILPRVPGAPASGAIIATRGLDSAVRGLKKKGKRPQLACIDDPDTEDTARSDEQADKLELRIERAIGGLGGQRRSIARVMLTTLQNRRCVSFRYTDSGQKPTWRGKRFRYLVSPPERADLWDEYVHLRKSEFEAFASGESDDRYCRKSFQFFVENREAMEAGAVVANENRFDPTVLPDGLPAELCSLQHYYNEVARLGPEAVATEYDNDPPEEVEHTESGISATKIQLRLSGYERKIVPFDCPLLVQGIDIKKAGGHWVVRAVRPDGSRWTVDYGFHESHGTVYGSDEGVELAVRRVILERMDELRNTPYQRPDGTPVPVQLTLVDSGWMSEAVYQACSEIGLGIYPSKGHGRSHGCATPNFTDIYRRSRDRKPGDGYFLSRLAGNRWLVHCDTDRWKAFEHARWLTQEGKPGAAYLFGTITDQEQKYLRDRMPLASKEHHAYAHHVTSETEVEEFVRGKLRRYWKLKSGRAHNHYLDASYLCNVAAAMLGANIFGAEAPISPVIVANMSAQPQNSKDHGDQKGWFAAQQRGRRA